MSDLTKVPTATLQAKSNNLRPMASDPDSKINAKEARTEAFYTKEEEPWKKGTVHFSEGGVDKTRPMTKDEYLDHIRTMSVLDIEIQQCQFAKFRDNVVSLRPDLAGLNISFTLDEEGQIKILDPDKVFNSEQLEWLTDSVNKIKDFKQTVQSHARKMMELVDHDTETFGNRYVLNLSNFANTIDYGLIISIKDQYEMNNAWITQILEKGEHREERMIDVRA
jgi:hypothetical protein